MHFGWRDGNLTSLLADVVVRALPAARRHTGCHRAWTLTSNVFSPRPIYSVTWCADRGWWLETAWDKAQLQEPRAGLKQVSLKCVCVCVFLDGDRVAFSCSKSRLPSGWKVIIQRKSESKRNTICFCKYENRQWQECLNNCYDKQTEMLSTVYIVHIITLTLEC